MHRNVELQHEETQVFNTSNVHFQHICGLDRRTKPAFILVMGQPGPSLFQEACFTKLSGYVFSKTHIRYNLDGGLMRKDLLWLHFQTFIYPKNY